MKTVITERDILLFKYGGRLEGIMPGGSIGIFA